MISERGLVMDEQMVRQLRLDAGNLAAGVDLVAVHRIAELLDKHGERFIQRVFTAREQADCSQVSAETRLNSLAARWAAKEAVAKALGTGFGPVNHLEVEVARDECGCPHVHLHGQAAALAQARGLNCWAISLSHDGGMALAFVVALGAPSHQTAAAATTITP
jgi:holo-[acyl-carrier protein] synthase